MSPFRSPLLVLFPSLLVSGAAAQGVRFQRAPVPRETVRLDLATGTLTLGPTVTQRTAATVGEFPNLDLSGFVAVDSGNGAVEWFNDGVKGASGNASDLVTSIVLPYTSVKLDPALGGPGGSAKLGFYEGYTRNGDPVTGAPNGTAVAVFTLTGLPAHTASSTFFSTIGSGYMLALDLPEMLSFADGPIGYSWGFLDSGTDGVLGGTGPFLANASSCSGANPGPPDAVGQTPYVCCSDRPADAYRNGILWVVFTFAPYCYPFSMAIDIREARDAVATAAPFTGDGLNADMLVPAPAIVGRSWSPRVTLGHGHGAGGVALLNIRPTAVNGPNFVSPIGGRTTEILLAGPLLATLSLAHDGVATLPASIPVPAQLALVCQPWAAQATVAGGGFVDLSTAASGVTGTQ